MQTFTTRQYHNGNFFDSREKMFNQLDEAYALLNPEGAEDVDDFAGYPDMIFVFGSNNLGLHAGGAAKFAKEELDFPDMVSQGMVTDGFGGGAYALPTCSVPGHAVSFDELKAYVNNFLLFATDCAMRNLHFVFFLTPVGTGIAGFTHEQVAPLFSNAPYNVMFPPEWKKFFDPTDPNYKPLTENILTDDGVEGSIGVEG